MTSCYLINCAVVPRGPWVLCFGSRLSCARFGCLGADAGSGQSPTRRVCRMWLTDNLRASPTCELRHSIKPRMPPKGVKSNGNIVTHSRQAYWFRCFDSNLFEFIVCTFIYRSGGYLLNKALSPSAAHRWCCSPSIPSIHPFQPVITPRVLYNSFCFPIQCSCRQP